MTEIAGYIVYTPDAIFGVGETEEAAWADAEQFLDHSGEDEEGDDPLDDGSPWCAPATAALIAEVQAKGGRISWGRMNGVHCTNEEEDAAA